VDSSFFRLCQQPMEARNSGRT